MTTFALDVNAVLDSLDRMTSQRPVAAQIVATSNKESSGAKELAAVLGADVALTGKVLKLANSAYFGMSGKVTSLQFAVTVVGFSTVRSMATVALSGIDAAEILPDGFWDTSVHLAAASAALGPLFGQRTADAMCLGLLAQLGAALLHQADPDGYDELVATSHLGARRFDAETERYGISAPVLTAEALRQWRFSPDMVDTLRAVESGFEGGLLRVAYELTARLVQPAYKQTPVERLSDNRMRESEVPAKLAAVRGDVGELRSALGV
jgi:HD-like signal output (HDOD) protein